MVKNKNKKIEKHFYKKSAIFFAYIMPNKYL